MTPNDIRTHLCRYGVTVHHVTMDATGNVTLYLESNLGQSEMAVSLLQELVVVMSSRHVAAGILRITTKEVS